MMDERYLKAQNDAQYRKARKNKSQPYVAKVDGDEGVFKAPFFGCYKPEGWELLEKLFVDSSGFGADNEPALSIRQFLGQVKAGRGYSIASVGQFQVYVNVFERERV